MQNKENLMTHNELNEVVDFYFSLERIKNPTKRDKDFMYNYFQRRNYTFDEAIQAVKLCEGFLTFSFSTLIETFSIPIIKGNHSVYEYKESIYAQKCYKTRLLNTHEIPIIKKKLDLNEVRVYDIPEAKRTRPTKRTIEYLLERVLSLNKGNIETFYYRNKKETNTSIAMTILINWKDGSLSQSDEVDVISSLKVGGYYLVYEDKAFDKKGDVYKRQYFEPYWPEKDLIRSSEYIYHVTAKQFDESIRKNGFIPKSESDLDYPDRVYFFLTDDRQAMFNHMRSNRKFLKKDEQGRMMITIYKVKVPDDLVLFLDTRTYDQYGELVENAVYSYDPVPAEYIESHEDVNLLGQSFNLFNHIR